MSSPSRTTREEQANKVRVRDSVLAYLEPRLEGVQDAAGARELIGSELDGIRSAAETAAEGREVSVTLGREYYPTRDYGTFALPAGQLRVAARRPRARAGATTGGASSSRRSASPPPRRKAPSRPSGRQRSAALRRGRGVVFKFRLLELWGELMEYLGLD